MAATLEQVEYLATHIANLKAMENEAAIERHKAEAELAEMICIRDEGTETVITPMFKVSVTNKLNRTLDYAAYQAIESGLPEGIRCVDLKPSLNIKKLRALEMIDPLLSAQFVTTAPAKPSVKIEVRNGN